MIRLPKQLPPRYKKQFDDRIGEWKVKKKFKYVNENGETKDTETKWKLSIEEAEAEARRVQENHGWGEAKKVKKLTIAVALKNYVDVLEKEAKLITDHKNSTAIDVYESTHSLYTKYTPDFIGDIPISEINVSVFARWIDWINKDIEHRPLSGVRVKKFKQMIRKYIEFYLFTRGYISASDKDYYLASIKDVKVKSKKIGTRKNRNQIEFNDLKKICNYYKEKGIGTFNNFYWYVFYTVLFCTGMRVGEMVALQWKNIYFSDNDFENIIDIKNSIGEKEKKETVEKIIEKNNLEAKNEESIRRITMWAYYKDLLKDYKRAYMFHYGYKNEDEMKDAFVFTNLRSTIDKKGYQKQRNALREINNTMNKLGLPKTDDQMFRHACAKFLIYYQHYSVEETHDYFGHQDSKMINETYAELQKEEKRIKVSITQNKLITNKEISFEQNDALKFAEKVLAGDSLDANITESRKQRELAQINRAISKGQKEYKYPRDYENIIQDVLNSHPELNEQIVFTKEN